MPHFLENGSTMPAIDTAPAGKTLQPLHTRPFGKVPRFTVKAVHFPGGNAKGLPPGGLYPGCANPPGGKCPNPVRNRFTFPVGMPKDCRLEGLCPGCANPPGRKVPGFRGKTVHFPGGNAKGIAAWRACAPVARTRQGGKCPDSGGKRFTFPVGMPKELPPGGPVPRLRRPARREKRG